MIVVVHVKRQAVALSTRPYFGHTLVAPGPRGRVDGERQGNTEHIALERPDARRAGGLACQHISRSSVGRSPHHQRSVQLVPQTQDLVHVAHGAIGIHKHGERLWRQWLAAVHEAAEQPLSLPHITAFAVRINKWHEKMMPAHALLKHRHLPRPFLRLVQQTHDKLMRHGQVRFGPVGIAVHEDRVCDMRRLNATVFKLIDHRTCTFVVVVTQIRMQENRVQRQCRTTRECVVGQLEEVFGQEHASAIACTLHDEGIRARVWHEATTAHIQQEWHNVLDRRAFVDTRLEQSIVRARVRPQRSLGLLFKPRKNALRSHIVSSADIRRHKRGIHAQWRPHALRPLPRNERGRPFWQACMAQRLHKVRQSAHGACHTRTLQLSGDVQGIRRTSEPRGHPSHLAIQALRGKALRRFPEHITCSTHVVVADQGTEQPKRVFFGARRTWAGIGAHCRHVAATRRTDKACAIAHDILWLVLEHALHRLRIAQLSIVRSEPPKRCCRRAMNDEPLD